MKELMFNIGSVNNSMEQLFWSFALCREKSKFADSGTQRLTEEQLGIEVSHSVYKERYCMLAEKICGRYYLYMLDENDYLYFICCGNVQSVLYRIIQQLKVWYPRKVVEVREST